MSSRLALAAVAFLVLVAGCGGGDNRRDAVVEYIDDANAIQRQLLGPLAAARRAYEDFTKSDAALEQVRPRLAKATRTIEQLERRLARLQPPADAKRLHALLLELVEGQAALAHEVELVAEFLPKFQDRLASLRKVEQRLRASLEAARTPAAQAAAIERYGREIGAALPTMEGLQPPAPMTPAYEAQVETLVNVRRGAAALARALRDKDAKILPTRLREFAEAARGSRSLAAQRANIAAVKAYNRRITALGKLADRVSLERLRLQKTLG